MEKTATSITNAYHFSKSSRLILRAEKGNKLRRKAKKKCLDGTKGQFVAKTVEKIEYALFSPFSPLFVRKC